MVKHPLILTGQVVRLEPLRLEHVPPLMKIALATPEEFIFTSTPTNSEQGEAYFAKAFHDIEAGTAYVFVMIDSSNEELIGTTRFTDISWTNRHCELGYTWFMPKYFSSAVNIDSKLLLLSYLFEDLQMLRVQLNTDARNLRSQAAVKALGASYEGTLRSHKFTKDGFLRDTMVFSIIQPEWPEIKEKLLARLQRKLGAHSQ